MLAEFADYSARYQPLASPPPAPSLASPSTGLASGSARMRAAATTEATLTRMPRLTAADRHVARRFSWGLNPQLAKEVRRAGSGRAWLVQQLGGVADAPGDEVDTWFPSLRYTPQQIFDRQKSKVMGSWEVMWDLSRRTVSRRILGRRQVHEVMVDFWSNLLHVPLVDDAATFWRVDYDRVVREHALGTFEDLLVAAITHPAMGLSLDNAVSTKDNPNENLGRELLELHTVGRGAGYTEADVKASSRMLTGYRVDTWWPQFRAFYDPAAHATGRIDVLGFSHANTDPDGRAATEAYLRYLARHPATAQRIARRLAVRFVGDRPSSSLVDAVAAAYLKGGTAVRPTLLALVDHPDFAASAGTKVRLPTEDYVATARALRLRPTAPTGDRSFANAMYWQYVGFGQAPYEWPAPDGYSEQGEAWTSAGRLLGGMLHHVNLAAGWWPAEDVVRPGAEAWLPSLPAPLGDVVDHIGRQLFGQRPAASTRQAVATLLDIPATRRVSRSDLWDMRVYAILASLLDSPTHLHR